MANDMTQDELNMYEKLYELTGARVRITSDQTVYQGIIASIITGLRMVSLRHTSMIGGEYLGLMRFRFSEISSLSVVESREVVNRFPRNEYILNILKNKAGQKPLKTDVLCYDGLSDPSDDEDAAYEEVEEFILELPPHLKTRLPCDSTIVDIIDEHFDKIIRKIFQEKVIGVSFEGSQISRFSKLACICISTMSCVYLFDIEKLKDEAFDNGLRDLFEDPFIKKVIHDCRFPSDCLAHQYSTQLTNVFDTQVADFVVSMQCYNDKYEYKYISSLDCCLRNHLHVPPEFLYKRLKGLSATERNAYFTKRPISNEFRYDLIKNALYLILLHQTLAKKLLGPLHKNVNAYLDVIANASNQVIDSLGSELSSPDTIPPSLLMNGIQTAQFKKPQKKDTISLVCKFKHPVTGQVLEQSRIPDNTNNTELGNTIYPKVPNTIADKTSDKENHSLVEKKSKHKKVNHLNVTSAEKDLVQDSELLDCIIVQPSNRHLDEVYHKLVHNLSLRSQHSESVIHVKPSENYVSKFSMRKPFSNNDTTKCFNTTGNAVQNPSDDIWKKLRAAFEVPDAASLPLNEKYKNIQFIPAGMSC